MNREEYNPSAGYPERPLENWESLHKLSGQTDLIESSDILRFVTGPIFWS